MIANNSLPPLLLQVRKQQGLSREELASLAQVSTSFIRDAEKDTSNCSYGKLMSLIAALGVKHFVPTHEFEALQFWGNLTPEEMRFVTQFAQTLIVQRKSSGRQP